MRSFLSPRQRTVLGVTFIVCMGRAALALPGDEETAAQPDPQRTTIAAEPRQRLVRLSKPPVIDGVLEDTWKEAKVEAEFYEVAPMKNVPAELKTEAYLGYDDKNFYFAFRCYDSNPKAIRANSGRDKVFIDDLIGVYVDTFGNGVRAYEFLVNPRGVQMDAMRTEGQPEDYLWDRTWTSAGKVVEDGWIAEGRVPLNILRIPNKPVQAWKFLLVRLHPSTRGRMNMANFKMDYTNPCMVCQFPAIQGPVGVKPGRNLTGMTTLTSHDTRRPLQLKGHPDAAVDPGVGVRWEPTPTTEFEIAGNPDFSQIEADVNQLAVNNRFVPSFPERRPFFLEANDAFAARGVKPGFSFLGLPGGIANGNGGNLLNLFYSRSIADPLVAAKLGRRSDDGQLSMLWAVDDLPTIIVADPNKSTTFQLPYRSVSTVVRYRQQLFNSSSVAVGLTDMRYQGGHSTVASTDALLRPFGNVELAAQYARSDANALGTQKVLEAIDLYTALAGRKQSDDAFSVQTSVRGRTYNLQGGYTDIGRDFRADLGFLQQTDLRTVDLAGMWQWMPETNRVFVRAGPALRFVNSVNHQGFLMERTSYIGAQGQFRGMTFLRLHHASGELTVGGTQFHNLNRVIVEAHSRPIPAITPINLSLIAGDLVDVVNVRRGKGYALGVGATLRPLPTLSLATDVSRESLKRQDTGAEVYNAQIARLLASYQITERSQLRSTLQYSYVDRDPRQYVVPVLKTNHALNVFLLYTRWLSPRTAIYLGYNDSFIGPKGAADFDATHPISDRNHPQNGGSCTVDAAVGPAGFQGSSSGLAGQATTSRCRTLFFKFSHTLGF
jgi:hypothetical protein